MAKKVTPIEKVSELREKLNRKITPEEVQRLHLLRKRLAQRKADQNTMKEAGRP